MLKKFLSYAVFIMVGTVFGLLLARYLKEEHYTSNTVCIIAMSGIIIIFIIVGHLILSKSEDRQEIQSEREEEETEIPQSPDDGIWGWVTLKQDALKSGFPLSKERIIIGRDVKSDIMLNDESISRQHAEITKTESGYFIKDTGSKNGVFVNNQRLKESILHDGDDLYIGNKHMTIKIYKDVVLIPEEPPIMPDLDEFKDYDSALDEIRDLEMPPDEE